MAAIDPRLKAYFTEYEVSHRTKGNHISHFIGIPLILMGGFGLLNLVELFTLPTGGNVTLALIVFWLLSVVYTLGHRWLGLGMVLIMGLLLLAGSSLPWQVNAAAFVVGWISQIAGHFIFEKAKPSFFKNLIFVFVGPIYMLKLAVRMKD